MEYRQAGRQYSEQTRVSHCRMSYSRPVSQLDRSTILSYDESKGGGASEREGGETVESEREGHTGSAAGTQSTGEETANRDEQLALDSGNI